MPASARKATPYVMPGGAALRGTVRLARQDYARIADPVSATRREFEADFVAEMAAFLGVPSSRVRIVDVKSGSVIVTLELAPSSRPADPTPARSSLIPSLCTRLTRAGIEWRR